MRDALGDVVDENLEKYGRDVDAFFRPTHVRISGMYSSIFNDAPMGFSYLPLKTVNPASLALQLLGAHEVDLERVNSRLDIYEAEDYLLWSNYFFKDLADNHKTNPNVILPCKRIPPILSRLTTWESAELENEVSKFYLGKL